MKSLKSKLILGISIFIIVLFSITAFLQVQEKQKELINDIFIRSRSFAELTAQKVVDDYKLYLIPNSFVYFNRDIQDILAKNEDVSAIKVVNFSGDTLYDSSQDKEQKYAGEPRINTDPALLQEIQSKNISVKTLDDKREVYFKKTVDQQGGVTYESIDFNEKPVKALATDQRIEYMAAPGDDQYSVIFDISYAALAARVQATELRIMILAVFGVGLGILLAFIFGSNITRPIAKLKRGAEILSTGDFSYRVEVKTRDEIYDLAQTFNTMAGKIQEGTTALIYRERVGKELELAEQIQMNLLPKTIPVVKGLDVCAGIIPAEEIGGDCYDFLMPNENELLFYLGDVTGHGVPSGIVVSIANALFYTFSHRESLVEIISEVNGVLKAKTMSNMFMTLVLMKWIVDVQKFSYVSAGHEQIIHYRAKEDDVVLLPSGGLALGMIKNMNDLIQVRDVELEIGDVLFIYSDGIPEAWRSEKEMYGMERLKAVVKKYAKFPNALSIRNALMSDVYLYREGYKQMDDITCIVVKRS
jgi:serine phosphatase RsbU (regulator of sigma subunit)